MPDIRFHTLHAASQLIELAHQWPKLSAEADADELGAVVDFLKNLAHIINPLVNAIGCEVSASVAEPRIDLSQFREVLSVGRYDCAICELANAADVARERENEEAERTRPEGYSEAEIEWSQRTIARLCGFTDEDLK